MFHLYTSRFIPHSRLITGFVTRVIRRVLLVEQELPTLPEHPSSPPVLSGVCDIRSSVLCVFCSPFALFLLATVLSVLLWYTDSDYPIGILKLFLVVSIGYSTCNITTLYRIPHGLWIWQHFQNIYNPIHICIPSCGCLLWFILKCLAQSHRR